MTLKQAEAVIALASLVGNVDGGWSKDEQDEILQHNSAFREYFSDIDLDVLLVRINRGEITRQKCIDTLKTKNIEHQLNAITIAYHIMAADGKITQGEQELLDKVVHELEIDMSIAMNRLDGQITGGLKGLKGRGKDKRMSVITSRIKQFFGLVILIAVGYIVVKYILQLF